MSELRRPIHTKEEVQQKYDAAALAPDEFQKAIWGSHDSMMNRFRLARDLIDWTEVESWLDVGCGTGTFFAFAEQMKRFRLVTGCDLSGSILNYARVKSRQSPTLLIQADVARLPYRNGVFDLVTLIGVLQDCGTTIDRAFSSVSRVLRSGGQVLLTTKNIGWRKFQNGELTPESDHEWFSSGEVKKALTDCGVSIVDCHGLLPREGELVPIDQSHTMIIKGVKE